MIAAFEAWGDRHFTNTSLALVADRLGVTKQAIYRHFANKADLVDQLTESFLAAYATVRDAVVALAPECSLDCVVRSYVRGVYDMFAGLPHYYFFLVLKLLPRPSAGRDRFYALGGEISARVAPFLERARAGRPGRADRAVAADAAAGGSNTGRPELVLMYLHVQVVVWCAFGFWTPLGSLRDPEARTGDKRDAYIEHTVDLCLHGLFREARHDIDYRSVEGIAEVRGDDLLVPDRIFAAVEAVVSEFGFEAASLDKIAKRLGMTKSSLYFYFENKNTMFSSALQRERRHFRNLFLARAERLGEFSRALYGYVVALASYFLNNRSLMVFSNWVQVQQVPVPGCQPDEREIVETAEFMRRRLAEHHDPLRRQELLETLALLSILMNRGLGAHGLSPERRDELFDFTAEFYRVVTHGVGQQAKDYRS